MKIRTFLSLTLAIAATSAIAQPAAAAIQMDTAPEAKPASGQVTYEKQGLTYEELFDLEERFIDTVVYSMMDADGGLIEAMFDIRSVRVSDDGRFATVGWRYGDNQAGTTLLEQQGDAIVILTEDSESFPTYTLEAMGVPSAAAAEISNN